MFVAFKKKEKKEEEAVAEQKGERVVSGEGRFRSNACEKQENRGFFFFLR